MKAKNESVKRLEVGKDYIEYDGNMIMIIIDRKGDKNNNGFLLGRFKKGIVCSRPNRWREAPKEEVIEAFRKYLPHRFGEDWQTMKIKKRHPDSTTPINEGSWEVEIVKSSVGWNVWNKNGLLYCNGIWVERLDDIEAIKAGKKVDKRYVLKREVLTILSVESKLNPDKKISEYLEQFKLILEVL